MPKMRKLPSHAHCSIKNEIHTAKPINRFRSTGPITTKEVDFKEFQETRKKFMKTDTGFAF
jgi:hypothetical protein